MKHKTRYLELIWYKSLAELQVEMSRAYVGFLWWVLEPVLYMLAFYVGFGLGVRSGGQGVAVFMLCALVPWKWFSSSITSGSVTMQVNSGLLQQVYLPKFILPLFVLGANTIKFFVVLLLLLLYIMIMGHIPTVQCVALPVIILVQLALTIAITSLVAATVPLIPDLKLVVDNGLMILMFISGVFFDVNRLPTAVANVLKINPMVPIIESFRAVLLYHTWPDWAGLGWAAVAALVIYAVALWMLRVYDRQYVKFMAT